MVFNHVEDVWQLKWPPVTHLASNWQLTSLPHCQAHAWAGRKEPGTHCNLEIPVMSTPLH